MKVKGAEAARLRQRKHALLREFNIPNDAIAGSLVVTHRRCGKPTCHCASSEKGHPMWQLTYTLDGKKHVEAIPAKSVEQILPLVDKGRQFKAAVAEVFAINAQLLSLWKREQRRQK